MTRIMWSALGAIAPKRKGRSGPRLAQARGWSIQQAWVLENYGRRLVLLKALSDCTDPMQDRLVRVPRQGRERDRQRHRSLPAERRLLGDHAPSLGRGGHRPDEQRAGEPTG